MPDLTGKNVIVTGANSGIGLETARAFAEHGAHVILAVRDPRRGTDAADHIPGSTEVRPLDLADLASVRAFADGLEGDVDVLINNAGVMAIPERRTADGFEMQIGTNHLGHFALANLLLPRLTDRVVVVGSASHRAGDVVLDDLLWERRKYAPYAAYAASKLANMLFLAELQRRLTAAGSTLRVTGGHPGTTATHITSSTDSRAKQLVGRYGHRLVGMAPWQGALPTLYAATMDVPGNTFLGPHGVKEMMGWPVPVGRGDKALDPDLAKALWTESERLSGVSFPL